MASMGFEYRPEPFPEAAAVSETPFVDSRFESIRSGNEPSHLDQMLQEFAFGDEDAYYVALRGRSQFSLGEALDATPRAEEYGCELHAAYEIVGVEGYRSIDSMSLLLGDLSQEASADPRVVDAMAAYDSCLAESEYSSIGEQIDRETGQATLHSPILFWDEMRELEITMNAIDERCAEATEVWVIQDEVREKLWREEYQEEGAVIAAEVKRVTERNRTE